MKSGHLNSGLLKHGTTVLLFCLLMALSITCNATADPGNTYQNRGLPLWEAGIGIGAVNMPDYRGSDEQRAYAFPIPYFVYRGDKLRVDRRGVRGLIFESGNFGINFSADLGIPVNSDKNLARLGMPDLDIAFHIGPSLDYLLYNNDSTHESVVLKLPIQLVTLTDLSSMSTEGWYSYPHINYIKKYFGTWGLAFGPTFATKSFHHYYYGVDGQFATAERPAYQAAGGVSGIRLSLSYSRRIKKYWVGTFVRYENIRHSVFQDSPLVRQDHSLVVGAGISWILFESEHRQRSR